MLHKAAFGSLIASVCVASTCSSFMSCRVGVSPSPRRGSRILLVHVCRSPDTRDQAELFVQSGAPVQALLPQRQLPQGAPMIVLKKSDTGWAIKLSNTHNCCWALSPNLHCFLQGTPMIVAKLCHFNLYCCICCSLHCYVPWVYCKQRKLQCSSLQPLKRT